MSPEIFESHRRFLLGLAYRMLGSLPDAEDAVQDTWLRASAGGARPPDNAKAYLAAVLSRLCIDRLRQIKRRRAAYIGPWLPDPVPDDVMDPAIPGQDLYDSLATGLLLVLERLGPVERAALLLHDLFGYSHQETADLLGRTPTAIRQSVARARTRLQGTETRFTVDRETRDRVTATFFTALQAGDVAGLERLLTADAACHSDGGGEALAARNVVYGANAVARLLTGLARKQPPDRATGIGMANGTLCVRISQAGRLTSLWWLETAPDGRVAQVFGTVHPAKLARYAGLAASEAPTPEGLLIAPARLG